MKTEGTEKKSPKETTKKKSPKESAFKSDVLRQESSALAEYCNGLLTKGHPELSNLELRGRYLTEESFIPTKLAGDASKILKLSIFEKWQERLDQKSVVILSYSANRCVDLLKNMGSIRAASPIAKLFARHIKEVEQLKFLQSHPVIFSIGTPGRVSSILGKDGISRASLAYLVIDSGLDPKGRCIFDIAETRKDLLQIIYMDPIISRRLREGECKIVIF